MTGEWERAVRGRDIEALERLVTTGADVDARDRHGQTGVMIAAHLGFADVVRCLIRHGAALDHTAKFGLSALMLAVIAGYVDVVRILVEAGAATDLRGTGAPGFHGMTALDLAVARGRRDMVDAVRGTAQ